MTNRIILSLSSNKPDRLSYLNDALKWLSCHFNVISVSDIYEMPALNGRDKPYLNTVAEAVTSLTTPADVELLLKAYEAQTGRTPESKNNGIIPLDIDIIIWNDTIIRPKEYEYEYFTRGYRHLQKAVIAH